MGSSFNEAHRIKGRLNVSDWDITEQEFPKSKQEVFMLARQAREIARSKVQTNDHLIDIYRAIEEAANKGFYSLQWVSHDHRPNPTKRMPDESEVACLREDGYTVDITYASLPLMEVSWS